jgi:PBSX family phage terminase large subunit
MVAQATSPTLKLFPRQMRFVKSAAKYPAYIGGIGSGKSFAGGAKVISRLGRPETGMIAAPTYQMLRDSTLEGFFRLLDDLRIPYEHVKSENTITFPSGHKILCRSLEDPDKARGPNLDYAWIDEAGYVAAKGWQIVKGRVRVGVNPQAWLTSTPKGRNWIWEEWERDGTGNEFDQTHPLFRVRTEENPELPDGFAESLGYSGTFAAQELGGEFVAFEGLVYPGFNRGKHVKTIDCTDWATVLGLDIGTRNPTSLGTYRYAGDRLHKERELYRRGMSSDQILDAVEAEYARTNAQYVVIDPSGAGMILSLQQRGVRCRKGVNDVLIGISTVTSALNDFTVDPSCVNTIAEAESYRYPDGKRGNTDSPVKENDHAMDELRYVCMDLYGKPKKRIGML